jgi:hypothetical protein
MVMLFADVEVTERRRLGVDSGAHPRYFVGEGSVVVDVGAQDVWDENGNMVENDVEAWVVLSVKDINRVVASSGDWMLDCCPKVTAVVLDAGTKLVLKPLLLLDIVMLERLEPGVVLAPDALLLEAEADCDELVAGTDEDDAREAHVVEDDGGTGVTDIELVR